MSRKLYANLGTTGGTLFIRCAQWEVRRRFIIEMKKRFQHHSA